jgi:glycosyltransferase 2 family protein
MKFRRFMQVVSVLAVAILVLVNLSRFGQLVAAFRALQWYVLPVVVAIQLVGYYCNAKYYQVILRLFGHELSLRALYESSLILNYVNQAFPSGGISGISYLSGRFGDNVPAGKLSLAQLMRYGFTIASYTTILVPAFIVLFFGGNLVQVSARFMVFILLIIIIVGGLAALLVNDRIVLTRVAHWFVTRINSVYKWVKGKASSLLTTGSVDRFIEEFYNGYSQFLERRGHWGKPFLYSLGANICEVLTVWVVFLALGQILNLGVVIAGYTLANLAALASPLTGGAGAYEATMVATLVGLGIPLTYAFTGVLVYRVFNMAFFLPAGFVLYHRSLERG